MAVHYLVLLQVIMLLWTIKASTLCQKSCGGIRITYPFGIGDHCYFNKWFEVNCNHSYRPPKPFLTKLHLEISRDTDYSLSDFTVGVKIPVTSSNSSNNKRLNLLGSPYSFANEFNRLAAIGCDKYATLNQINGSYLTDGCLSVSTCDPVEKLGCYDFLCDINPSIDRFVNETLSDIYVPECKSVIMVDQDWLDTVYLKSTSVLKGLEYVPATLQWGRRKGYCEELFNSDSTWSTCNRDGYCLVHLRSSGYHCRCLSPRSENRRGCQGYLFYNTTSGNTTSDKESSRCPEGYHIYPYDYEGQWCDRRSFIYHKSRVKFFIIVGCSSGFGVLFLVTGAWWLYKFIKRRKEMKQKQKFFKRNGGLLLQQHMSSHEGNIEKTKLFTSKELEKATDNYNANRILGQGGQGTVFKGMLDEGRIVAIKKSKIVDESKLEEFINEVVILSQINHRNVVQLLGCCLETDVPLLVYEFIPNGTLFQYIHDENEEFPITWELRLRIAVEVSRALSYLHSSASIPIYHRDIKSTNILLDDKYRAKVSDFGTSRSVTVDQTHLTTQVHGTFGYVDPEYFRSSQFTEKSDVYSFGVVLAELLTGQKPIRAANFEEDRSLAAYFICAMKENRLFEILDSRVLKEGRKEEVMIVANLTRRCLNLNGKKRPTMREISVELAGIRELNNADSILQQNCGEIDSIDDDMTSHFETGSSFTGLFLDSSSFSIDADPLISK